MNTLSQVEKLVSIILASFEVQFASIHLLNRHRFRPRLVYELQSIVFSLLKTIETMEGEFLEAIEEESEEMLGDSANTVNILAAVKRQETSIPEELFRFAKKNHLSFTTSLAEAEEREEKRTIQRFAAIKREIRSILARVENL